MKVKKCKSVFKKSYKESPINVNYNTSGIEKVDKLDKEVQFRNTIMENGFNETPITPID